jgi:hypothetical protein
MTLPSLRKSIVAPLIVAATVGASSCVSREPVGEATLAGEGEGSDCTKSHGFWKNHEDAWPVASLTLGSASYTKAELLKLLRSPVKGDASIQLAHQLIAALLNVAAGAPVSPSTQAAIDEANGWMTANADADGRLPYGTSPGGGAASLAHQLNETLTTFNEEGPCEPLPSGTGGSGGFILPTGSTGVGGTGGFILPTGSGP